MSTAPNMATITAALERSLQNCSLSHSQHHQAASGDSHGGIGSSSSSDEISQKNHHRHHLPPPDSADTTLELNSHLSLPYHWEQCLDLKTGEIYYINWRNGMKAKEDPRSMNGYNEDYYSDEDDDSSYDSEESSTESSTFTSSREHKNNNNNNHRVEEEDDEEEEKENHVLVVAGCKSCLMYFMVPKHLEDCPKCTGQLLHFDRSENDIP